MSKSASSGAALIGAAVQSIMTKPKATPAAVAKAAKAAGIDGKIVAADLGPSSVPVKYAAGTGPSWRSRYHSVAVNSWRRFGKGTPEQTAFALEVSGEPFLKVGGHVYVVVTAERVAAAKRTLREFRTVERMVKAYGTALGNRSER